MGEAIFWVLYTLLLIAAIVINVLGLMVAVTTASVVLHIVCLVFSVGFYMVTAITW